ncbi:protein kinase domain protein [Ichthyophthirius multifiliis]|uniref:Protein kinase domain protein n=1 Tax=Ichthyophthirius multifiliis TaxID=5932 RepID=G0R034_ICHMU|nr:protein kinase domain protein [Ichthyophthirius multifiliis]EGR29174.1 protein kinase domain protein [Ichthyophthirius multifiliis]|eukprot:XP_004030410.1 protein kinase domain protein [Ichthyophthirius multifiliis]
MNSFIGTPITMAPEVLFGKKYNEKCDIWSIGVIIYQLIFGKNPFCAKKSTSILELVHEIKQFRLDFTASEVNISSQLQNLLQNMLSKDPNQRIGFKEFFENEWVSGKTGIKGDVLQKSLYDVKKNNQTQSILGEIQQNNILKMAFSLRKYYEKRIFSFLAHCNSLLETYEKSYKTKLYKENENYKKLVFLSAFIIYKRLNEFINEKIYVEIKNEKYCLENMRIFLLCFQKKGKKMQIIQYIY